MEIPEQFYSVPETLDGINATYRIIGDKLGGGLSGITYEAEVSTLRDSTIVTNGLKVGQRVVIKVPAVRMGMPVNSIIDRLRDLFGHFLSEFTTMQRLDGLTCAAQLLDYGQYVITLNDITVPVTFMVQRKISGNTLDKSLGKGFQGVRIAAEYFDLASRITRSLMQVHHRQVAHGDIWEGNLMIENGTKEAVLIDFGEALLWTAGFAPSSKGPGSRRYVPPPPESPGTITADIYALGCTLLYLATGKAKQGNLPRIKDMSELKEDITQRVKIANGELYSQNRGVVDVIARCVRYHPEHRIRSAQNVLQELERFSENHNEDCTDLNAISSATALLARANIPLFSWMAALRMKELQDTIEFMAGGGWDLSGPQEDLITGMFEYMSSLGSNDQYLTVTVPSFWDSRNITSNGRVLTMNVLAAQRGATIRRIFLITKEERNNRDNKVFKQIFESQIRASEDIAEDTRNIETAKKGKTDGGYWVGFHEIAEADLQSARSSKKHKYGIVIKNDQKILIVPEYTEDDVIMSLQFRTNRDLIAEYLLDFDKHLHDAQPLRDLYSAPKKVAS